jgi:hypothetical protein
MARKKRARPTRRELARRAKIRKGLARYHRDVRAVKKATKLSWRESQQLIPPSVRRGGRRGALLRRGDLLDVARERYAVTRETEYLPPAETAPAEVGTAPEHFGAEITYIDLLDYLISAARSGGEVEFRFPWFELDAEKLEQGPRASEVYREFAVAGDQYFAPMEKARQWSPREWRLKEFFLASYSNGRFLFMEGTKK